MPAVLNATAHTPLAPRKSHLSTSDLLCPRSVAPALSDLKPENLGKLRHEWSSMLNLGPSTIDPLSTSMADHADNPAEKRIFTTGEAAELCGLSQQTIIRSFDKGRIHGFKVPGSKFRRIPRDELIRFMKDSGIPVSLLGEKYRILIVDDDPTHTALVEHALASDGRFECRAAANGYDAGLETERFRPDVILLDFMLPDIDGAIVCRRVRERDEFKRTRVLFISAVSDDAQLSAIKKAGADDFVRKPINAGDLVARLSALIAKRR